MRLDFFQIVFLLSSFIGTIGLVVIIFSRNKEDKSSKLFILILILILGYLISHTIHFILFNAGNVTILDLSCHSLLLTILVSLTFFTWNFPKSQKTGLVKSSLIILPTLFLLILLWSGNLIIESHSHSIRFEAHYTRLYPLFLLWYLFLILINIYSAFKKYKNENEKLIKKQILFYTTGLVITNIITFIFGLYLPWQLGFYYLVEMSPLAFFVGVILFTAVAIGKYDMFPATIGRLHNISLNKKIILSALVIVPIIILLIQMPLIKLLFPIESNAQSIHYFLLSILGGLIVSISISYIIIVLISNPINKMTLKVQEIGDGRYGTQLKLRSNDEIGTLAQAFNKMSTTLKVNAEELRRKEERIILLLNAFDKSAAAIAITDQNFKIIEANLKFSGMTGLSKTELQGNYIYETQFNSDNDSRFMQIKNLLLNNNKFNGEVNFNNKIILISVTPTSVEEEKSLGYLFVELDITEQKNLESQLFKAEKLAALGEMAAVLAHEIKTPLTSIKMNADILAEEYVSNGKEETENFGIIKTEINRLNNLVKDVLQFSRQMDLTYSVINLHSLIDNIGGELDAPIKKKNIEFNNITPEIEFYADAHKLKQVFLNLISNSAEAIEKDGIIEVSASTDKETGNIKIIFSDTGSGIKNAGKVFEPFFTTKASGTGLGLAVAQKIIEQHKGSLRLLSSVPGKTVFEVVLPHKKTIE